MKHKVEKLSNIDEIRETYPAFKLWSKRVSKILYEDLYSEQLITEFLYTVNYKQTLKQLKAQLPNIPYDYTTELSTKGNISIIYLTLKSTSRADLDKVKTYMAKFGWYPSFITDGPIKGKYSQTINKIVDNPDAYITIQYESKYDQEISLQGLDYVYHITPDYVYNNSISGYGLSPKTKAKLADHPGRIYVLTEDDKEVFKWLADALYKRITNKNSIEYMYILKIDVKQIQNHKFFEDPNYEDGEALYTYENIKPSAISVLEKIKIN